MTPAILFDLDGVLADSRAAITTSINHALEQHGIPPRPAAELYPLIGPALADAFAELLEAPRDAELVKQCVAAYRAHYRGESLRSTTIVPGIREVLDELARDRALAVATSKPVSFAEPILEALGIRSRFATVEGPDLNPFGETKTATIARALATVGAPAVMVGDRRHDVEGARANGLPCVGVLWGIGSAAELEAAGATVLVERPADLPGALAYSAATPA